MLYIEVSLLFILQKLKKKAEAAEGCAGDYSFFV